MDIIVKSMKTDNKHWYAIKFHTSKASAIKTLLDRESLQTFFPTQFIRSLAFIQASETTITHIKSALHTLFWVYSNPLSHKPLIIPDREMELFMFMVNSGDNGLIYLGDDKPEYHQGDRVRVTHGPFKGAEGHIKRIKKDRRLIVTVHGVAAIATTFIHPDFLEVITPDTA